MKRPDDDNDFPAHLRTALVEHEDLVAGLAHLRQLAKSETAVDAVLHVPALLKLRLSWELWEALVLGDGEDPERLLVRRVPLAMLDWHEQRSGAKPTTQKGCTFASLGGGILRNEGCVLASAERVSQINGPRVRAAPSRRTTPTSSPCLPTTKT
jgi:hypothetical protein